MLANPARPLTQQHLAKFHRCLDFAETPLSPGVADRLIEAVDRLEKLDDVRKLPQLAAARYASGSCFSSTRPSRESRRVHSGVDRLDADGTRFSGQESTNRPIPGFVKNNTPSLERAPPEALGNHEHHGSGAVR